MREDLDEALCRDFPNLYKDRNASPQATCMNQGFPGDGWEPLIRRLSYKLESLIIAMPPEDDDEPTRCGQCKEKFGSLRYYLDGNITCEMYDAITEAERESAVTCEDCGAPGTLGGKGWVKCLCEECRKP